MKLSRRQILAATGAAAVAAAADVTATTEPAEAAAAEPAAAALGPTASQTTLAKTVIGGGAEGTKGYRKVVQGSAEPHVLRAELISRATGLVQYPLVTFVQLSDLHIMDDQSPLRVEFLDRLANPVNSGFEDWESAYRPHEFLSTHMTEAMVRTIRQIARGPVFDQPFKFTVVTGDAIDNTQYNETRWYIDLLDGQKPILPDSGTIGLEESVSGLRGVLETPVTHDVAYWSPNGRAANVLDDDYVHNAGYPNPAGLLRSARQQYQSTGLGMPWYAVFGNHDREVQGNLPTAWDVLEGWLIDVDADDVARDSRKVVGTTSPLPSNPSDGEVIDFLNGLQFAHTSTADDHRRLLDQATFMREHIETSGAPTGHGFGSTVSQQTTRYTIPADPEDLIQFITLDTTKNERPSGEVTTEQMQWLAAQLVANSRQYLGFDGELINNPEVQDRLIVIFGHHNIDSISNGADLATLLLRFPNVIAMVDGHTHANRIKPYARPAGWAKPGGFWEITSASHIDWPIQSRIIEIGAGAQPGHLNPTISIFTTVVDIDVPLTPTSVSGPVQLASWGRELALNDPTERRIQAKGDDSRSGSVRDRNAQLLLPAPFHIPRALPVRAPVPMTAVARSSTRMDLFAVASDDRTMWNGWDSTNGWAGWSQINAGFANAVGSQVTAITRGQSVEAYTVSRDNRVVRATNAPGQAWTGWTTVPGGLVAKDGSTVTALARGTDTVELFAIDSGDRLMHTTFVGSGIGSVWTGWQEISGSQVRGGTAVTAVSLDATSYDLFITAADRHLQTGHWNASTGWSGWKTLGTWLARGDAPISVVTRLSDHLDLFTTGVDGRVITTWWSAGAGWASEWMTVGDHTANAGSCVKAITRGNHIDLFIGGADDKVHCTAWAPDTGWLTWSTLNVPVSPGTPVTAVSRSNERFDVFFASNDAPIRGQAATFGWTSAGFTTTTAVTTTN